MKCNGFSNGQVMIPMFLKEVIRQANKAFFNLQKIYACFTEIPDEILNCESAREARIEWIEFLLVDAVVVYMHSHYSWVDTKRCEDFSHQVITNLKDNGVETLLQFYLLPKEDLSAIDGIGKKSVKYLYDVKHRLDAGELGGGLPTAS